MLSLKKLLSGGRRRYMHPKNFLQSSLVSAELFISLNQANHPASQPANCLASKQAIFIGLPSDHGVNEKIVFSLHSSGASLKSLNGAIPQTALVLLPNSHFR